MNDCFDSSTWTTSSPTLTVEYVNQKNSNHEIAQGHEAKEIIENLFPSKISPYIWFQGEALDKLIDFEFCEQLLLRENISVIPMMLFSENPKFQNQLRICVANIEAEQLKYVINKIKKFDV